MVRRYRDVCIQKELHFEFISGSGNVQILWGAVFTLIPNLVNYRISFLQISGSSVGSFLERPLVIEQTRRPAVIFSLRVRCLFMQSGHKWDCWSHRDFFPKGEEVRWTKKSHKGVSQLKKNLTAFLGLKEEAHQYGIWGISLKLFYLGKKKKFRSLQNYLSQRLQWAFHTLSNLPLLIYFDSPVIDKKANSHL